MEPTGKPNILLARWEPFNFPLTGWKLSTACSHHHESPVQYLRCVCDRYYCRICTATEQTTPGFFVLNGQSEVEITEKPLSVGDYTKLWNPDVIFGLYCRSLKLYVPRSVSLRYVYSVSVPINVCVHQQRDWESRFLSLRSELWQVSCSRACFVPSLADQAL